MSKQNALQADWVEKIFKKLTLAYGRDFLSRWEGQDISEVQADWAHELRMLADHPESIRHALHNLPPSKPPTVYEFRNLCATRPEAALLNLPAPDPAGLKRIADTLKAGMRPETTISEKAASCLANLRGLRTAGTINAGQRDFLQRMETGLGLSQSNEPMGEFHEIADYLLPPGMRAAVCAEDAA